jgi:hypothetical protein
MKDFIRGLFTDALGRPELKAVLGFPIALGAALYGALSRDWEGFMALAGFSMALLGVTAYADAKNDAKGSP